MPTYLTVTYEYASAEDVIDGFPGIDATGYTCEPVSDTPPVVLSGLVKGGEIRTATEWHAAEADALCVASDGRVCQHFWHYEDAVRRGALPLTWYRYETP